MSLFLYIDLTIQPTDYRFTMPNRIAMFSLIISLAALSLNTTQATVDESTLHEQSEHWPFYVHLKDDVKNGNRTLKRQTRAVLLRVQDNKALLDFGRDGYMSLDYSQTDILKRSRKIQLGEIEKNYPNFVRSTNNMFLLPESKQVPKTVQADALAEAHGFVVVYGGKPLLIDEETRASLNQFSDAVTKQNIYTLIIPTEIAFYEQVRNLDIKAPYMISYLSIAMVDALQHSPDKEGGLTLVHIDPNGRILNEWRAKATAEFPALLDKAFDSILNAADD